MSSATSFLLTALLLSTSAIPQTVSSSNQTFHIRGTVVDANDAVVPGAKVTFHNDKIDKTLATNERGGYEADLPIGKYTMTIVLKGFEPYRRPLFRVASAASIVFDATLRVQMGCDPVIVRKPDGSDWYNGEDWTTAEQPFCLKQDFFLLPDSDGVPFQLWIRYTTHNVSGHTYSYSGGGVPVFVAYNLFSLRADEIIYDARSRTITASGNVVEVDVADVAKLAGSVTFKVENGNATLLQ